MKNNPETFDALVKLAKAATELRDSGYDGPFIGEVCGPIFDAIANLEKLELAGEITPDEYRATEFDCGDGVSVKLCPSAVFVDKVAPEYWFIRRDLHSWDNSYLFGQGFRSYYWTEHGWLHCTSIQFPTAKAAIDFHRDNIKAKAKPA